MSLNRKMRRQAQRASEKNANVFKRSRFNEQPENGQEDESFIKNMLGSISKSPFMKKALLNAIGLTLMAAPAGYAAPLTATTITPVGNHTTVQQLNNNIYNITTGPRQQLGDGTALNAFSKFELQNGDIANFFTAGYSKKILNFVQDKVNIEGIVNSIEALNNNQNKIGGQLYFLSSNGVVIGSTGVVNTGSFYAIVPNEDFMNKIVKFTENTEHPFEESGFFDWTPDDEHFPNQTGTLSYNNDNYNTYYSMMQAILNHDASGITLSGDGQIIVNGKINAKNDIELLAGRTFDNSKKTADEATKIIIGSNAKLMTHANKDTFEAALNLSAEDKQSMNLVFEEDSFGGSISIKAIGYQNEADLTKTGYASGIKTEGELTATNNVEFVTSMATENAKATNHVSLGGTITADGGIRVNSNEILDANSNNQKTLTAKGVLDNYNRVGVVLSSDKVELSNATIKSIGNKVNIGSVEHSQSTDYHVSVNVGGNIEGSLVNVNANSGIQLENVTANGVNDDYNNGISGQINIKNYRNETANEGKIKVTGTLKSNGYVNNGTQDEPNNVSTENAGNITVDNGDYNSNSNDVFNNYSSYTRLSGKNADVELNEVYGAGIDIRGYDVSANIIKSSGETMKTDIVAGGNLTLGDGTKQEAPIVVGQGTLTVAATTIDVKGDIETGAINMRSNQGATLKGVKSINGNIGIDNYGTNGTVTINGNVVARKEDHYANIGIYNRDGAYSNAQGGSIAIVGDVEGKHVRIEAVDNVSLGNVTATYSEKENWDDEPGHLTIDGKNVTVAENKKLKADIDININAGEKLDSKGSIEAGTALSIDATDAEVKTTTSGSDTFIGATDSIIAHGKLTAGTDLRLGTEWQIVDNDTDRVVGTGFTGSITLEDDTLSGSAYVEQPLQSGLANYSASGGTDYTTYDTIIKAESVNSQKKNTAKGTLWVFGNGTASFNETVSEGKGYVTDRRRETEFNVEDLTANSITANGGVNISFTDNVTVAQKVESKEGNVLIGGSSNIGGWSDGEATINGAKAYGQVDITAKKVNLNNASAQLISVTANQGGTLSNLTSVDTGADVSDGPGYVYGGRIFGEAEIGGGRTYTIKKGIYAENIEHSRITGYEPAEEEGYPDTPIYEYSKPSGDFVLAGTITANNGGVYVYNDGNDIVLGNGNSAANITGQGMSLYTQGNITDNSGNNQLTTVGDSGSLGFRAIGGVTLANTAITSGGWFQVNNWFDNNAKVTISKDITAKTVHIEANKGIEVGNITANGGNITLDNETEGIDYDTKIRRPDSWSYPDGIDEEGKFDWGSTKPTGDIVVNGNLTATVDPSDPNGEKSRTGDITISNGSWSSYSQDDEEGATVVKNVTMKDATGRTIDISAASEIKAGNLTSTWAEQSPTRMTKEIKYVLDENGQRAKDEYGNYIYEKDGDGNYVYEDVEVENWDRTGVYVNASQITLNNVKSNNMTNVYSEKKVKLGDVEAAGVTITANEGITVGNVVTKADDGNVIISNKRLAHQEWRWVEDEDEGGNEGRENIKVNLRAGGKSELVKNTYTPASGLVSVGSVESKGKVEISNTSRVFKKKSSDEDSSSSYDSDSEYAEEATVDPSFNGASNEGVVIGGDVTGKTIKVISDGGIEVNGNMTATGYKYDPATDPSTKYDPNRDPLLNEGYSIVLDNDQLDELAKAFIKLGKKPNLENLRADIAENNKYSITAENGGVRIVNRAEGGEVVLQNVKGEIIYAKSMGDLTLDNAEVTQTKPNTMEETQVRPMTLISAGTLTVNESLKSEGGVSLTATCYTSFKNGKKYKLYGYNTTPVEEEGAEIYVLNESSVDLAPNGVVDIDTLLKDGKIRKYGSPEPEKPNPNKPETPEEVKQAFEDVGVEEGKATEEIDRTVNGNQENTDNSSNQEVSQVNDVSSLSDMGSDNIGGFEEMGSDAGGVDVGLSEGSAEFSMGADGSFEVASVGGAEDTGSGADAGTASDGGMAPNDGAMAEDNTASNDGAMAEDNTAPNDGAMAEDNTASDEGAVANDNTDSDTGNGEGSNSESSAEEGNDEKGEETASVDSSEEENEDNDKSGRPGKGKPGKEKNGGNKKLTQFRSMLHQAKDSATQQRR